MLKSSVAEKQMLKSSVAKKQMLKSSVAEKQICRLTGEPNQHRFNILNQSQIPDL